MDQHSKSTQLFVPTPVPSLGLRDSTSGQIYPLRNGLPIGRAHPEIPLIDQPTVSRSHGEFRVDESITLFAQATVRHPARHNGETIGSGCAIVLRAGDRLDFGSREFTVIQLSVLRAEPEGDVQGKDAASTHENGQEKASSIELEYALVPEPVMMARGRGGALVLLAALTIAGIAIWHASGLVDLAPPEMSLQLWVIVVLCAAAPLLIARVAWSSTIAQPAAHPVRFAGALLLLIAGLESALPEWADMASGAFSRGQGMGLAKVCGGDSLRSGPCADLYDSCGPRCRRYALPLLTAAAPLDDAIEKARAAKMETVSASAVDSLPAPSPAPGVAATAPVAAPSPFPESNIVSTLVGAPPRKAPSSKRAKSAFKAMRHAPPTRLPAKRRDPSSMLRPSDVDPADDAAYEPL